MSTPLNLDFRPETYWPVSGSLQSILSKIKGERRKRVVRKLLENGDATALSKWLLKSKLTNEEREMLGRMHPLFMGGEYLPNCHHGEVEIARIAMESTTGDVFSIRARPSGSRIAYRVVDEYDTEFRYAPKTSRRPLLMRQLISLIDGLAGEGWDTCGLSFLRSIIEFNHFPGEDFIQVTSDFYPQIETYYQDIFQRWYSEPRPEKSPWD
jgi:hypothetical protein